jgi:hypothetical protein
MYRGMVIAVLAAAGVVCPCRASIVSIYDDAAFNTQLGIGNPVLGMVVLQSQALLQPALWLLGSNSEFSAPLFAATGDVEPGRALSDFGTGIRTNQFSVFTALEDPFAFNTSPQEEFIFTGPPRFLYSYNWFTGGPSVPYTMDQPVTTSTAGLVALSGAIYIQINNLYRIAPTGTIAPSTLVAQASAYISNAVGLAAGPNGLLYTMGTALVDMSNCASGQWCVVAFDPTTGNLIYNFPVPESLANGAIMISSSGQIYLADGDGQGYVLDEASGAVLNTLSSAAVNAYTQGGRTLLTLDNNNDLYMFDTATGLHVFDVSQVNAPEPGSAWLLMAGVVLIGWRTAIRRGRFADARRGLIGLPGHRGRSSR